MLFLYFTLYMARAMRAGAMHYSVFGAFYARDIENWALFLALAARGRMATSAPIRAASSRMAGSCLSLLRLYGGETLK
jgi:hypothetical protein